MGKWLCSGTGMQFRKRRSRGAEGEMAVSRPWPEVTHRRQMVPGRGRRARFRNGRVGPQRINGYALGRGKTPGKGEAEAMDWIKGWMTAVSSDGVNAWRGSTGKAIKWLSWAVAHLD